MPTNINFDKKLGFVNGTSIVLPSGPGADFSTKSLSFDGVDEHIETSTIYSELDGQTKATFSFWIKFDFNQNSFPIWVRSASDRSIAAVLYTTGMLRLQISTSGYYATTGTGVLQSNTWHHVLMCVDLSLGYSQRGKIFVDGQDETTGNNINITSIPSSPYPLYIGTAYLGSGRVNEYGGLMDEIAIWAGQDLRNSVATLYNNGKPADLTSLNPTTWYRAGENSAFSYPQILMPEDTNKDKVSKYSLAFDGTSDYIDCGNADEFSFGNSTTDSRFSISAWVKMTDATRFRIVFKADNTTGDNEYGFYTDNTDNITFRLYDSVLTTYVSRIYLTSLTSFQGQWIHLVGTYDGRGGSLAADGIKIYLNGSRVDDATLTQGNYTAMHNGNAPINIGNFVTSSYSNGLIDEVAIFPVELTQSDAQAIYNNGIPNDISSYSPVGYWKLGEEAKFTDNWLVPNSALSNFSKYSFNFDGQDDYIDCGNPSNLNFERTDSFSVSVWFKKPSSSGGAEFIIGKNQNAVPRSGYFAWTSGNLVHFRLTTSGGNNIQIRHDSTHNLNVWEHYVFTYDGSSASSGLNMYQNGTLLTNVTRSGANLTQTTQTSFPFTIGAREGLGLFFNGEIDESSVFNSELGQPEVTAIYNGGKPKDLSGLSPVSWWRMGEEATYDAGTSQFTIPDQAGTNTGTSSNTMLLETLVGDTPQYYGGGISDSMDIFDRVGDAPNSENNTVSFNMEEADIVEDTP